MILVRAAISLDKGACVLALIWQLPVRCAIRRSGAEVRLILGTGDFGRPI